MASGVQITGLIKPLNGGSFPVWEDIDGLGGWRSVADITDRDAIPANYRKIGMVVVDETTGIAWQLSGGITNADWIGIAVFYQTVKGSDDIALPQQPNFHFNAELVVADDPAIQATRVSAPGIAIAQAAAIAAAQPFKGTYYVNPAFAGTQLGSQSSPFTSYTTAIAAAVAAGLSSAIFLLAAGSTTTENVVLPTTGNWELASESSLGITSATLNGNVTCNATPTPSSYAITNINVLGAVTGVSAASRSHLVLTNSVVEGAVSLTGTGAGRWVLICDGKASSTLNGYGGFNDSTTTVTGAIVATSWYFTGAISLTALSASDQSFFQSSYLQSGSFTTSGTFTTNFWLCTFIAIPNTFTVSAGTLTVQLDSFSASNLFNGGSAKAGAGTLVILPQNSQCSTRRAITGNLVSTLLGRKTISSGCVAEGTLTMLVPGTLGTASLNLIYTDLNGTLQTVSLASLLITSAAGTEVPFAVPFSQNGATDLNFSITGITTAGPLNMSLALSVRQITG